MSDGRSREDRAGASSLISPQYAVEVLNKRSRPATEEYCKSPSMGRVLEYLYLWWYYCYG